MLNSTHTLVGFALAQSGLNRWAPYATATAVIASNLPDVDIVTMFFGTATYLDFHRGFTHSLLGIPILSAILAAVMSIRGPRAFWKHFSVALIVMLTHPLLDWTNTYGVRPLQPFNGRWFYGDLLFVFDPYLDLILLAAVITSYHAGRGRPYVPKVGIILAVVYVAGLVELRSIARGLFATHFADTRVIQSTVGPEFLTPFEWTGFIESPTDVSSVTIDVWTHTIRPLASVPKATESAITRAAMSTYTGSVFRSFARFPVTRVSNTGSGYRVLLIDLTFFRPPGQTALSAEILLDATLHVASESISFVRPISRP